MSERLLIYGLVVFAIFFISAFQILKEIKMEEKFTEEMVQERLIVLGILASYKNFDRRLAQRETWLLSSKFKHKYMIDEWTPEWEAENEIYGDIVSINATFHGYATGFAEKLYHWYQHVKANYPKGSIVVKTDDDFYACENLYETVIENYDPRMYFGWWHPNSEPNHPNITSRPDAQFVAIGWELMEQVLEKPYCHPTRDGKDCNPNNPELRYDTNSGGNSLGSWLGHIGNITGIRMNERMSHTINEKVHRDPTNHPYCGEMISYHKATPELQRYLECYDQNIQMSKKYCHKARNMTLYNIIKGPKKGSRR